MKLKEIQLTRFKRFTDTKVTGLPATAKLVLLAGPNGSGKSSLFDALLTWHLHHTRGARWDADYHSKQIPGAAPMTWDQSVRLTYHSDDVSADRSQKAIYARSAYRNEAEFRSDSLQSVQPALQEVRFNRLIDNDQAVSTNYRRMVSEGFADLFNPEKGTFSVREFTEGLIGEIRDAMERLFPGLRLNSLGNPLSGGSFRFDKGESRAFLYKNLSGGEKAAFDLILDLYIKRREFDDTVFLIDEPEAHMAAAVQARLLDELLNAIPDRSQMWIATHSLGMIRRATDIERSRNGTVCFLDFDGQNFDVPTVMTPVSPDRPFWKRALQIALDDMSGFMAPEEVVICEGGGVELGQNFDAFCYSEIFQDEFPNVVFVGAGDATSVVRDRRAITNLVQALAVGTRVTRLRDRDDCNQSEVADLGRSGVRVLSLRTIESYLLDDSVLKIVCEDLGSPDKAAELLAIKARALAESVSAGGRNDDLKRIAGDIYVAAKTLFPNKRLGSDKWAFMKAFCGPAVNRTTIYPVLRRDVMQA